MNYVDIWVTCNLKVQVGQSHGGSHKSCLSNFRGMSNPCSVVWALLVLEPNAAVSLKGECSEQTDGRRNKKKKGTYTFQAARTASN